MSKPLIALGLILCLGLALPVCAQDQAATYAPTRYGAALLVGASYDPQNIGLVLLQGQVLIDYERIAWHAAPDSLRLKFEVNAGLTTGSQRRGLFSFNMLALNYLEGFARGNWTPYVEAGIGLIYTDFRVKGQGLRFNFNPQAGAGFEYALPDGTAMTLSTRLHHLSNGDLYRENRGANSALLLIGYLF